MAATTARVQQVCGEILSAPIASPKIQQVCIEVLSMATPTPPTYTTWLWDDATGSRRPSSWKPSRFDPLQMQDPSDAGYQKTAAKFVQGKWVIQFGFELIPPVNWKYMVDFMQAHRGGVPFYLQWPWPQPDIFPSGAAADPGGTSQWSSEVTVAANGSMTLLVYFPKDELPFERRKDITAEYYKTSSDIEVRQC